jgi:hypothetical protein
MTGCGECHWETSQWTVPVNLVVSQVLKIGVQPISLAGISQLCRGSNRWTGSGHAVCGEVSVSEVAQ